MSRKRLFCPIIVLVKRNIELVLAKDDHEKQMFAIEFLGL